MRTQKLFISDETFYEICRPNFDLRGHLTLEEDKIKIVWIPGKKKDTTRRNKPAHFFCNYNLSVGHKTL